MAVLKDIGYALNTLTLRGPFSSLGQIALGSFSCEMAQITAWRPVLIFIY